MVRETAGTLQLVTPDSRFVVVPKQVGGGLRDGTGCWGEAGHGVRTRLSGSSPGRPCNRPHCLQLCTWEFDADRRRVVTLLGPGLAQRGAGGSGGGAAGGGRPKTLREAIRGQQHQQQR